MIMIMVMATHRIGCTVYANTISFSKIFLSLWHARIVKKCLNVKIKRSTGTDPLTREYYEETVSCLKLADTRDELINVLEEFAIECRSDSSLKLLAFETLDVFIVLQAICRGSLFQSETGGQRILVHSVKLWASCLDAVVERGMATLIW
jgi:hypothetical protein